MKVGDKVRSKEYAIEGVIQEIGPCGSVSKSGDDCDEMELTLDPRENGVRFYHHASNFEVVIDESAS